MNELFDAIQAFLHEQAETSDEAEEQTYEQLLAEFYQIPSYVERFKKEETSWQI